MALDGIFLHLIKNELSPLIGGKVDKIYQPSREELVIALRHRSGLTRLLLSASAGSARVGITENTPENPLSPPMYCMLLRKHLTGGRLSALRQDGLERILFLDFDTVNELGDPVTLTLACEIMGRCSNIVLIGGGKIIDAIKRVDGEMSRERMILPGMSYSMPPRSPRLNLLTCAGEDISAALALSRDGDLAKVLVGIFEGISPIFAREAVFYAAKGTEPKLSEMTPEVKDRLIFFLKRSAEQVNSGECTFTAAITRDGTPKDFCFIPIRQYGTFMKTREYPSPSALLDSFYAERDTAARMKQKGADLFRLLAGISERTAKKLEIQRQELRECRERDSLRETGELISANLYRIKKGDTAVEVEDFHREDCPAVTLRLDPALTPQQNAAKYFTRYRKAANAEQMLVPLIEKGEDELRYIDDIFDALTRARTEAELEELRAQLTEQGYIRRRSVKGKGGKQKKPALLPPLKFQSSDGFEILVGRNPQQNDNLTRKVADPDDIWLHTHNIPGSHVIIRSGGKEIPDRTIEQAASLAAFHSKAKNSSSVPVDYTLARYVKKPAGARPGFVIFTHESTAFVTPSLIQDGDDESSSDKETQDE